MAQYLVCSPVAGGGASVAPCVDVEGVGYAPAILAQPAPGEVDFALSNELFAYGFSIVLVFWAVGVCVGAILSLIQKGE